MTEVTTTGFATIMEQCGFAPAKPSGGAARAAETTWALPDDCPGVTITHRQGDAASPDDLEPVVADRDFDTCIVLGTAADAALTPHSEDTRVLSILLLLRHLLK